MNDILNNAMASLGFLRTRLDATLPAKFTLVEKGMHVCLETDEPFHLSTFAKAWVALYLAPAVYVPVLSDRPKFIERPDMAIPEDIDQMINVHAMLDSMAFWKALSRDFIDDDTLNTSIRLLMQDQGLTLDIRRRVIEMILTERTRYFRILEERYGVE